MSAEAPIDYEFTRKRDLVPGKLIKIPPLSVMDGYSLPAVDAFFHHIARLISGRYGTEIIIVKPASRGLRTERISEIIDENKSTKKFFGKLGESTALVLPTNVLWMDRVILHNHNRVDLEQEMRFLDVLVETKIPGRNESLIHEILFCGDKSVATRFYTKVRPVTGVTFANVDAYINAGGLYAEELREGLNYIYPQGMPSQKGKREI